MTIMIMSSGEDLRIIKNFKGGGRTAQFLEELACLPATFP
jgi:hypothetical protein